MAAVGVAGGYGDRDVQIDSRRPEVELGRAIMDRLNRAAAR